ncbi:MAG: TSUP family transporter [Myxococcota bacterium]
MDDLAWLVPLGLFAGALTTLAGLGGGLVLTIVMAAVWGPAPALATAAPALLVGNVHRVSLYRAHFDGRAIAPFVVGAVPGALFGGLLTVSLPEVVLRGLLLFAVGLAVLRELRLFPGAKVGQEPKAPPTWLVVGAMFVAGVLTATSGGGGLLLAPLLLMRGLKNERFVVAASSVATSIHIARVIGYGAGGLVNATVLTNAAIVAGAILVGNVLGRHGRGFMTDARNVQLTYGVLAASVLLTVLGFR